MAEPFQTIARLIEGHVSQYWGSLSGMPKPLHYENVPFSQPRSGEWVTLTVRTGKGVQASIGSRVLEKMAGVVFAQVFVPKWGGTRRAMVIADAMAAGLRYRQLVGDGVSVDLYAPSLIQAGEAADHYQMNVQVEFQANYVMEVAV